MALDFPNSPTAGQQFTGQNGVTYNWDGVKWSVAGGGGGGQITPPIVLTSTIQPAGGAYVELLAAGGSLEAPAALQAGEGIGGFYGGGYDGSGFTDGGQLAIDFYAAENWIPGSTPTRMTLGTTPAGATHAAPALEIDSAQNIDVTGNLTAANFPLQSLQSSVADWTAAPTTALDGSLPFSVANLALSPGDWDIWGTIAFRGTPQSIPAWEFVVSSFIQNIPNDWGEDLTWNENRLLEITATTYTTAEEAIMRRVQVTAPTTYYLTGYAIARDSPPHNILTLASLQYKAVLVARRYGDAVSGLMAPLQAQEQATHREAVMRQVRGR